MLSFASVDHLEEALSRPTPGVLATLSSVPGDVMILGAGGKMGPTLARMVRRGCDELGQSTRQVIAVSRFSNPIAAAELERVGVRVIRCDLHQRDQIAALPEVPNLIYMAGQKFGTQADPDLTWVANTVMPSLVAERFHSSRMVALSTGCVYPLVPWQGPGSREDDPLGPPGEYANSCVGRERVLSYHARQRGFPLCLVRLCYAIDMRYGVLLDLAQRVHAGLPIDVTMGATHVIWQGDANARVIECLSRTAHPPVAVNVTGRERLTLRDLAHRLGTLLNRPVRFVGVEAPTAWVWNADQSYDWFGPPTVSLDDMLHATADWVMRGGETLNKPTHFEVRDGQF